MMNSKTLKIFSQRIALTMAVTLLLGSGIPVHAAPDNATRIALNSSNNMAVFTRLDLYPNIETIGVVVTGTSLPKKADLMYRQNGETTWHSGHPLMRIDDGRLVGSLFGLSAATSYSIKVLDGSTEITGSVTTQTNEVQFAPSNILHVNDDVSPGGDGSVTAPFKSIQDAVNRATPGTQVLVADGLYHEAVSFPASGNPGSWIQVKAEGNGAILDGSENLTGNIWTPVEGKKNVWSTKIGAPIGYLSRDQLRFYMYDNLSSLYNNTGHNNVPMNEGWYIAPGTTKLYVRSLDDPSSHAWQVPTLNQAFNATGRDWLWIEGFEIRFYGQGDSCGVCATNVSHVVIRGNRIHNVQKGIFIDWTGGENQGNDTRIEYNEIYDPAVSQWPWSAVKGSSMEGTAIIIRGHIGAIVRGNNVHHFFNGIYTGSSAALENSALAFDVDIYNNHIHQITDDALEPEGASINQRFRNNTIESSYIGISLAPVTQGPAWVLRSSFANFTGRGIKWDRNSDGIVLVYHNDFWTDVNSVNAMDFISPAHNAVLRNNIFKVNAYGFEEVSTGSAGHDWNYDNWYSTRAIPHFKWENILYDNIAKLCLATGLECNGHEEFPGLTNPAGGDFTLLSTSPNIDRGIVIPGINDNFMGNAPDVGMLEFALDQPPTVVSNVRSEANPTRATSVNFTVTFSESVTGVDTAAPFGDFALASSPGVTGASITAVTMLSGTTYTVTANTGSGNGTLGLNLIDDDSIVDGANNRLGGTGVGNGNFFGETYDINKNLNAVIGIVRADPDNTALGSVRFLVNFSGDVSGVGMDDFSLVAGSNISGATIANVNGAGAAYTVTVNTGIGDGTLRLDLIDNDTILDAANNPLGGAGSGNGNFIAGETYKINRNPPTVTSSLRADPNPTNAGSVRFLVSFSEAVSGVDSSDFNVTVTGNIVGTQVTQVSGSGNTYAVTINTGTGNGSIRLDVVDNDSIVDSLGLPLGGVGLGNGGFSVGDVYTSNKPVINLLKATFRSNGANDGWILESGENSNGGGTKNSSTGTFYLGDDSKDRQYRVILHFQTTNLPDNAVVTQIILVIKRQSITGTDPFGTHQNISIDIRKGPFGSLGPFGVSALQVKDFQAPADMVAAGTIMNNPVGDTYWSLLNGSAGQFINLKGVTQFRLMFQLDDNDDSGNDYFSFFSGDYKVLSDRPQLEVEYYTPR